MSSAKRDIVFKGTSFDDFNQWRDKDKVVFKKRVSQIEETRRTPFSGTGKPEKLKHQFAGCWSRRITGEHRLVYMVTDNAIEIVSCRYHYE